MQNVWRFSFMFIAFLLPLLSQSPMAESIEQKRIRVERVIGNDDADRDAFQMKDPEGQGQILPLGRLSVAVAEEGFVDNGDGTVTDTKRNIMWQKGDNGKEVLFVEAQEYCRALRLGGYTDWRLPKAEERETAVVIQLLMRKRSRDVYAFFDLYWTSDPTILIPFNYRPAYGKEVSRVYYAREGTRGFVRAVRSLGNPRPGSGS
jgi:hypothetical protein